jgi:hypothetical protein
VESGEGGRLRLAAKIENNGGSMKSQTLLVAVLLSGIGLWAGPAYAQVRGVRARIPFHFTVAEKTFAAGEYTMVPGSHQVHVVSQVDGRTVAMVMANDVSGQSAGANGRIIFRCYGERCFLAEVWSPMEDNGRQVLSSRAEAESKRERRGTYFAVLGMEPRK